MRRSARCALCLLLLLLGCAAEDPALICDAASLADALALAAPGDRIALGSCRIEGDFALPPGVALSGGGSASVIAGADVAITAMAGEPPVRIEDLSVEGGARAGVILRGSGSASLRNVRIEANTGIAFGADGLSSLSLTDVSAAGPIDFGNQGQIPYPPDRAQTATHGIVAARIADLAFTGVTSNGFAGAGVLLIDSTSRWEGGDAAMNLGLGLHVQGGSAELIDVSLDQTFRGTWGIETYGGAFTASAAIDSIDLVADDNWYGLLHHGGTARHFNLSAQRNQNAGVWAQFTAGFELTGTLAANDFAGLVAFRAAGVNVHDARIEDTHEVLRPRGEVGSILIGDGIQLVESTDGARLVNLDLIDNERVGLLIELGGGSFAAMEIADVRITASGGNGAVLQHGSAPVDWDDGCIRTGVTAADDRLVNDLDFVDVVGPCGRPDEHTGLSAFGL